MLSSIRNNRKALSIVLWLVIIAFVATIFVVWGVGEQTNTLSYVAKVNDKIITYEEYQNRYKLADDEIRRYGGAVQIDNLSKRILESLIAEKVMLIEAEKLNIPATDLELVSYIRSIPSFQNNGVFNLDQYEAVLRNNGLTTEIYEKSVKDEIKRTKMTSLIYQTQSIADDKEIENEYNYRKSTINLKYAAIPLNTFEKTAQATPSDNELKAYYDMTKEVYRVPAEIKLKYITFDKNKYLASYDVPDEVAKDYFNSNKQHYTQKESADVSMIFIKAQGSDNVTAAAKSKIDEAYKELESGKSFAQVADNYTDKQVTPADGHKGIIEKGSLSKDVEDVIFKTEANTFSKPFKTMDGYYIVYVHSKKPAKEYTFEEKKDEIKASIKNTAADDIFNRYTLEQFSKLADNGGITALQKESADKFDIKDIDFISEKAFFPITAVAINPDLKAALFKLDKGGISQRVVDGSIVYIFEVVDKKPSYIPEMDKVKEQLLIDYKVDKITKEGLKSIESSLAGSGFDKTASNYNAKIDNVSFVRENAVLEGIFKGNNDLIEKVIKTKSGDVLPKTYLLDNNFYIFQVAGITPADKNGLAGEKDTIANYISSIKGNTAIDAYVKKALEKTEVKYNQDFLKSMNIVMP